MIYWCFLKFGYDVAEIFFDLIYLYCYYILYSVIEVII